MPPQLALVLVTAFVVFAFRSDRSRGYGDTSSLFWPSLWYLVVASRMVGVWFNTWGLPLPSSGDGGAEDGSPIDRYFFALLTVIGFAILARRRFDWGAALSANPWLTALLAFMAISIIWSDYPFVSFKRYIKVIGSIVMALVVLTNERPMDAFFTVLRRCLYIHLPMSILCVKYFREIGVAYDWSGSGQMWQGISTSKNTLGQVAMLGVLYFFTEVRRQWPTLRWRNLHFLYLGMSLYLLKGGGESVSMTSVSVSVFAMGIYLRIQSLRQRIESVGSFVRLVCYTTFGLIALIVTHSIVTFDADSLFGTIITKFGRDITLTDRTFIWDDVYKAAAGNPLLGVGFGGFWIGRMANIPWNQSMTWTLGQAHSGYIDTYLQVGLIGVLLLAVVIFSSLPRLVENLHQDYDLACFRITMLLTIVFVNVTETTFLRGDHHLWFVTMLVLWILPSSQLASNGASAKDQFPVTSG
jgi:exopolysaccharide production protein ExoQ